MSSSNKAGDFPPPAKQNDPKIILSESLIKTAADLQQTAAPVLLGFWRLDKASCAEQNDNGSKISLGDVSFGADAALFAGNSSSFLSISNNNGVLEIVGSLTITLFVWPGTSTGAILRYENDGGFGVQLWQHGLTTIQVRFSNQTSSAATNASYPVVTADCLRSASWNHISFSYNTSSGVTSIFSESQLVNAAVMAPNLPFATKGPIRLGSCRDDDKFFNGRLAGLQIFSGALTPNQIQQRRPPQPNVQSLSPSHSGGHMPPPGSQDSWKLKTQGVTFGGPSDRSSTSAGGGSGGYSVSKRLYPGITRISTAPTSSVVSPDQKSSLRKVGKPSGRLLSAPKRRQLPPIDRGPKLLEKDQKEVINRLYEVCLKRLKAKTEKNEAIMAQHSHQMKPISQESEEDLIQRMYYQQKQHDVKVGQELEKKYVTIHPTHHLSADEVKKSSDRLYADGRAAKSEMLAKLVDKYITQTQPKFSKMTAEQQLATANRLFTRGGS